MPTRFFENFSLDALTVNKNVLENNRLTGPVRNRLTGRSTGRSTGDFEIYRSGGVEKILTGSISDTHIESQKKLNEELLRN